MASIRPRLKNKAKAIPTLNAESYALRHTAQAAPTKRRKKADEPLILLQHGNALTQDNGLPRLPGQVGLRSDRPLTEEDIAGAGQVTPVPLPPMAEEYLDAPDLLSPSKHRTKRLKQWQTWENEILPLLISPYLELLRHTESLREEVNMKGRRQQCHCCTGQDGRILKIWVVRFSSMCPP